MKSGPVSDTEISEEPVEPTLAGAGSTPANAHEEIARIAYSYWEARGCQHGFAEQDWVRAEAEYRSRLEK